MNSKKQKPQQPSLQDELKKDIERKRDRQTIQRRTDPLDSTAQRINPFLKRRQSKKIAKQVEDFLKNGGRIEFSDILVRHNTGNGFNQSLFKG